MTRPSDKAFLREHSLALKLQKAGELITRELDSGLAEIGSSSHQLSLLVALANRQAGSPAELSRVLRIDPAAVTRGLDRLEERLLIARVRGQKDRRSVTVNLTKAGESFAEEACGMAGAILRVRLSRLSRVEFDWLTTMLSRVMIDSAG